MSSLKRRPDGKWRARYDDPTTGKERARHFDRKIDAQRFLDEVTTSVVTGQYVDPRAGRVLVRDYAAQWEATLVGRPSTLSIADVAMRLHVLPELGARPMASVRRSDVQALVKRLEAFLQPGTIGNVYDVLRRMFGAAVDDKVIAESPCRRINLPPEQRAEVVPPTLAEVDELAASVPPRYRAVVVLLAGSGLRIGEVLGLKITDVDFLRRELRVERQRLQNGQMGPPKTDESYRAVPLGRVVVDELAAHLAAHGDGSEWLFTTERGAPLTYGSWTSVWEAAQRQPLAQRRRHRCPHCRVDAGRPCVTSRGQRAQIDHAARDAMARGADAVDTHALRHFYASCLISGGASVYLVSRLLGHASASITLKVYAHLWPGDDDRARDIVDATLGGLRTGGGLADHG